MACRTCEKCSKRTLFCLLSFVCFLLFIPFVIVGARFFTFFLEVDCIERSTAYPNEQFVCAPGKKSTLYIEREHPLDVGMFVVKENKLPSMHNFTKYTSYSGWVDTEYWQFYCNVLTTSVIDYNCSDDSNLTWYVLDNKNMYLLRKHEDFIPSEAGFSPFQGTFKVNASGQYHIVVRSRGEGFSASFNVNVTYKLYDTTKLGPALSCQQSKCSIPVASDEVMVLQNRAGKGDVRIYTKEYTQFLAIYISVSSALFILIIIFDVLYCVSKEKKGGSEVSPLLEPDDKIINQGQNDA